jgi:hypothetical protein
LRVAPGEKGSKWDISALIHPVDANRGIVDIRGGSRSIEVLQQVDVVPKELSGAKDARQLRRHIVETGTSFKGKAYNILHEPQLCRAAICSEPCLGAIVAYRGTVRPLRKSGTD